MDCSVSSKSNCLTVLRSEAVPSFILMAIQGPKIVAFVYELKGDSVLVSKSEFVKETPA